MIPVFLTGNSQEQFRNVLYSVYMLNAPSHMQSQIVLTVAVLRVVDIVPILLKQKKIKINGHRHQCIDIY